MKRHPQVGVFADVATDSHYEDDVNWAVENGLFHKTDDTKFSPDDIYARAQVIILLWRRKK